MTYIYITNYMYSILYITYLLVEMYCVVMYYYYVVYAIIYLHNAVIIIITCYNLLHLAHKNIREVLGEAEGDFISVAGV